MTPPAPGGDTVVPAFDAVLFDLYDTLVWTSWPDQARLVAGHLGVSEDQVTEAYHRLRRPRDSGQFPDARAVLAAVAEACDVASDPGRIDELATLEAELLAERVRWYDDSLPVLRRLREEKIPTAVVSNCSPSTRPVVDRLGLEGEVDAVLLSCELGEAKPSPGIFSAALQALGVDARQSLFVDDRGDYLDGATQLGMRTVRIARETAFGEEAPHGDHAVVTDLTEIVARL